MGTEEVKKALIDMLGSGELKIIVNIYEKYEFTKESGELPMMSETEIHIGKDKFCFSGNIDFTL